MRAAPLIACAVVAGCAADQLGDDGGATDPRVMFVDEAWPALARCVGCHQTQPGRDFLAPGDPAAAYDTLFAFQPPVLDLDTPAASLLVTMGKHTGPALAPPEITTILDWLDAERAARIQPGPPPIVVGPVVLALGAVNRIDLAPAGAPGAVLDFIPQPLGSSGLTLTELELTAGPTALHLTHPLFVSNPPDRDLVPDPIDRFADVDDDLGPAETLRLGGGTAIFIGFSPADPLSIHIRSLEEVTP